MKQKTMRFEDDVLFALKAMTWREDGRLGVLTAQLERKLYEKVNKALEAMGGKWNRKVGGHVFLDDPRPAVDGLIDNGTLTVDVSELFVTRPAVARRMLDLVDFGSLPAAPWKDGLSRVDCLEPSAGTGALVRAVLDRWTNLAVTVDCCELDQALADGLLRAGCKVVPDGRATDFLTYRPGPIYGLVVMNPPFSAEIAHVTHAYECLRPGGTLVSVMSEGPFFRDFLADRQFRVWLDSVGFSERLPDGSFSPDTGVATRLVVIRKAV